MANPKLPFCTPQDLYATFGRDNILQWAFTTQNRESIIDNDTTMDNDPALLNACNLATIQVVSRMFRTRYWQLCRDLADNADGLYTDTDIPLEIKHAATIIAANNMFLARYTNYSQEENGKSSRLKTFQEQLDAFFSDVERNKISIGSWTNKTDDNAPAVVESVDNIVGKNFPTNCNTANTVGIGFPIPSQTIDGTKRMGF